MIEAEGGRMFLSKSDPSIRPDIPYISLASFARSGNSMTRSLMEEMTCMSTGSHMAANDADLALNVSGFRGDSHTDSTCFCCKSHFPG